MDAVCHVSEIRRRGYVMLCYVMYTARIYRQTCLLRALAARGVCKQRTERDSPLATTRTVHAHHCTHESGAQTRRTTASAPPNCAHPMSGHRPPARGVGRLKSASRALLPHALVFLWGAHLPTWSNLPRPPGSSWPATARPACAPAAARTKHAPAAL